MKVTDVYIKNLASKSRYTINQGGTSSSKSYSILQVLIDIALTDDGCLISVVSESLPHLKRGVMRDFFKILMTHNSYSEKFHNKTNNSYKLNNSTIEFFGADSSDKLRGARRDYLFINECNNVDYEVFNQLEIRTKKKVFLDFNPVSEFWVHTKVIPFMEHTFIKSTYKDALNVLDDRIIKAIESRKDIDPNWWKVYGEGNVGSVEGLVFETFTIVDELPAEANLKSYGLDFGYTNDPTSVIALYLYNNEIYAHELVYQTGLTNRDIYVATEGKVDRYIDCFADSSEPKSIDELFYMGWKGVKGVVKGADSIRNGIQTMKQYKINVTKQSVNLIKELRNYQWATDKFGNTITPERPAGGLDHAIDSLRYACMMTLGNINKQTVVEIDIF